MKFITSRLRSVVLAAAVIFVASPQPARAAGILTMDIAAIAGVIEQIYTTIDNALKAFKQYSGYIDMFQSVYATVKDFRDLSWKDLFLVCELPVFDGMEGIDDLRACFAGIEGMGKLVDDLYNGFTSLEDRLSREAWSNENTAKYSQYKKLMRDLRKRQDRSLLALKKNEIDIAGKIEKENENIAKYEKEIEEQHKKSNDTGNAVNDSEVSKLENKIHLSKRTIADLERKQRQRRAVVLEQMQKEVVSFKNEITSWEDSTAKEVWDNAVLIWKDTSFEWEEYQKRHSGQGK
jgi:hypothetical protein